MDLLTRNASLAAMSMEIIKALHSDLEDEHPLKGPLVFAAHGQRLSELSWAWGEPELYTFPVHGVGLSRPERWHSTTLSRLVRTSLALCALVGLLFGVFTSVAIYTLVKKTSEDIWLREEAERTVMLEKMGIDLQTIVAERETGGEGRTRREGNDPFLTPFVLLTKIIVNPLRQRHVNSLRAHDQRCSNLGACCLLSSCPDETPARALAWPGRFVKTSMREVPQEMQHGQFLYMRRFLRFYEMFCIENSLRVERSRAAIQRELVGEWNCRVQQINVDRLYGMQWRSVPPSDLSDAQHKLLGVAASALPPGGGGGGGGGGSGGGANSAATVAAFVAVACVVDGTPGKWLDLETRRGPDGRDKAGFRPQLAKWCSARGLAVPAIEIDDPVWCERAFGRSVRPKPQQLVRQIRGLQWLLEPSTELSYRWDWYAFEALCVLVHFGVVLPSMLLCVYAMTAQNFWALYVAPPDAVLSQPPLSWLDVYSLDLSYLLHHRFSSPLLRLVVGEGTFFVLLSASLALARSTTAQCLALVFPPLPQPPALPSISLSTAPTAGQLYRPPH